MLNKILIILKEIYFYFKIEESKFTNKNSKYLKYKIGDYTYGQPQIIDFSMGASKIKIGKFCSIADNVKFLIDGDHNTKWVSTYPFHVIFKKFDITTLGHPKKRGDLVIKNDVWIGRDTLIMNGIKIGNGCVIATGSVVTKDCPDYSIVGGVPAKVIKYRFSQKQIDELLKIEWWNWDIDKIEKNLDLLCSSNLTKLNEVV